jgi:hypothetical protein
MLFFAAVEQLGKPELREWGKTRFLLEKMGLLTLDDVGQLSRIVKALSGVQAALKGVRGDNRNDLGGCL